MTPYYFRLTQLTVFIKIKNKKKVFCIETSIYYCQCSSFSNGDETFIKDHFIVLLLRLSLTFLTQVWVAVMSYFAFFMSEKQIFPLPFWNNISTAG